MQSSASASLPAACTDGQLRQTSGDLETCSAVQWSKSFSPSMLLTFPYCNLASGRIPKPVEMHIYKHV